MASLISLAEARRQVVEHSRGPAAVETVALGDALGHRLAEDVRADGPWPATDRSAMDGFAVFLAVDSAGSAAPLEVVGESLAGHPYGAALTRGQAVRIMTGAVVPAGAGAVVPVEDTDGYRGATVTIRGPVRGGQHIRREGSEVAAGELLLTAGSRLRSAEIGALAVLGRDPVPVAVPPRIAVLATGDEVVPIGQTPGPHQVRDSNSHALCAQIRENGAVPVPLGIAGDVPAALRDALQRGLAGADVVLTIGGVSKGTHDLVHGTLAELGILEVFHGVALKPGKPVFFGVLEGALKRYVFGLPGNPTSSYTTFDLLVRPLIDRLAGARPAPELPLTATLGGAPFKENRRLQAVPMALTLPGEGRAVARLQRPRSSGDPFGLLAADGYALIPADAGPDTVSAPVLPYSCGVRLS